MSDSTCGCSNVYGNICRQDIPYPQVSHESVPSLIDNLVYCLYGVVNKSVVDGRIVWSPACDPTSNPAEVASIPRETGEGLLCYIMRVFQNSVGQFAPFSFWSYTGTGSQTVYSLSPSTVTLDSAYLVYINGVVQPPTTYNVSNTDPVNLVFTSAPGSGQSISILSLGYAPPYVIDITQSNATPLGTSDTHTLGYWLADILDQLATKLSVPAVPSTGTWQLGAQSGIVTWQQNRQLPPYPSASGQKLLSAPGNGGDPAWLDAPTIAVGPITSLGSNTPRYLDDRSSERVNVRDFGALGNWNPYDPNPANGADDTLAIQRAIYASQRPPFYQPEYGNPVTNTFQLTFDETIPSNVVYTGNKRVLALYQGAGPGTRTVFLPEGNYRITRPLVLSGEHIVLIGEESTKTTKILLDYTNSKFNGIETPATYIAREKQADVGYNVTGVAATNLIKAITVYREPAFISSPYYANVLGTNNFCMYTNGQRVRFLSKTGGAGLSINTTYYVVNMSTQGGFENDNTFQLAASPNGAAIDFTTNITAAVIQAYDETQWWINGQVGDFIAGTKIANLLIEPLYTGNAPTGPDDLDYLAPYIFPVKGGTVMRASGTSGSTNLTLLGNYAELPVGEIAAIKLWQDPTLYRVQTFNSQTKLATITPALSQTHDWSTVSLFFGKCNGIFSSGGENTLISRCFVNNMKLGAGIIVWGSSPCNVIENCMLNNNDIGYWIEVGPATLIKPSGDGNNTFLRAGIYNYVNLVCIGMKLEDSGPVPAGYDQVTRWSPRKNVFQLGTLAAGRASNYVISGGSINPGPWSWYTDSTVFDIRESWGSINLICEGLTTVSFGKYVFVKRHYMTGEVEQAKSKPRVDGDSGENDLHLGPRLPIFGPALTDYSSVWKEGHLQLLAKEDPYEQVLNFGVIGDRGSGMMQLPLSFVRTGTSAVFTLQDHGLRAGDWIKPMNYLTSEPTGTTLAGLDNWNGAMRVTAVTTNTISVVVGNSGATSGTAWCVKACYFDHHTMQSNNHNFQLPNLLGNMFDQRKAFSITDYQDRHLAGLRVASVNQGEWWASKSLNIGGTIASPTASILTGTSIPTDSAPNGSLFLRTDGDSSTTLYVRSGGTWKPLASYDP